MNSAQTLLNEIVARQPMSDEEISKIVDCSQPTIWRLRNGKSKSCNSDLYIRISKFHADVMQQEAA